MSAPFDFDRAVVDLLRASGASRLSILCYPPRGAGAVVSWETQDGRRWTEGYTLGVALRRALREATGANPAAWEGWEPIGDLWLSPSRTRIAWFPGGPWVASVPGGVQ